MSRRHRIYLLIIAVLLLVNLLHWGWPTLAPATRPQSGDPNAWRLRVNAPQAAEPRRNLFAPRGAAVSEPSRQLAAVPGSSMARPAPKTTPPAPAASEPPSPAPGLVNLGRLRLLGVVLREGRPQAYLALERDSVIARQGDTVFGQFAVERITVEAVQLRELTTHTLRTIPVSGR